MKLLAVGFVFCLCLTTAKAQPGSSAPITSQELVRMVQQLPVHPEKRDEIVEEIRRRAIVVLSDGEDTSSLLPFEEVLDLAKRSETAIYAIGLRQAEAGRPKFKEAEFVLRQLSQETGGRVFFPNTVSELPKIYEQISEELSSQYSIAYASKNPLRNGAWRRIVVRVNGQQLTARTKQGYFAPTSH